MASATSAGAGGAATGLGGKSSGSTHSNVGGKNALSENPSDASGGDGSYSAAPTPSHSGTATTTSAAVTASKEGGGGGEGEGGGKREGKGKLRESKKHRRNYYRNRRPQSRDDVYGAAEGANPGNISIKGRGKGRGQGMGRPQGGMYGWQQQQHQQGFRQDGQGFFGPGSKRASVSAEERERREEIVREGLSRAELESGSGHPKVAAHLFLLSRIVQEKGNYAEAEELCVRALDIYEEALGPEHPDVGVALNCLALSWQAQVSEMGRV